MRIIRKIINEIDYIIASILAIFFRLIRKNNNILLIPAADLNGGFGEDIMVYSFLQYYADKKIDLIVGTECKKYYANICIQYPIIYNKIFYTRLVFIMRKYSELHVIGADIMDGYHRGAGNMRFRSLFLAEKMGLKTNLTGLSVRKRFPKTNQKFFTNYAKQRILKARDIESYNRLQNIIPNKVLLTTDIAFLCPLNSERPSSYKNIENWIESKRKTGKIIVAFCPNSIQMKDLGSDSYYTLMIRLLNVLQRNNCSIMLLYHDLRKYALNTSDKDISQHIYEIWNNEDSIFIDDIEDGVSLKHYLNLADFTFTGRMHFGISGYVCGIPMLGMSYLNKFEGLQTMFELDPQKTLFDYSDIKNEDMLIKEFINNLQLYKLKVRENLDTIKNMSKMNFN